MAENPGGGAEVEAFGHGAKYFSDPVGSGLQSIRGRVAARGEFGATGLAAKILDSFLLAMAAVADERVDLGVRNALVETVRVGAGVARGRGVLVGATVALAFTPRFDGCA